MTKIASISLDIRKNSTVDNDPIVLRQGDSDVIIEASISNDGYPDLGINFATFVAKKPDGTIISNDPANVSGNVISYPISKHLTESAGKIQDAYFMINNEVTTNGFDISIIPSTQIDDTSVNYIPGIENINKFLESAETDWLGRIQQMKTQIDGLNVPDEFKLLMDKALSDAKAQYQPAIDAAEQNVENIVADLAAKKLDLTNNSDQLNQTITTIKTQVASINSFLDSIQKPIIDANSSFTASQQAEISQSIADGQKKLADSIASMQSEVAQTIADLKSSSNAAITEMQNNQSTAMAKVNQDISDTEAIIKKTQNVAVGTNLIIQSDLNRGYINRDDGSVVVTGDNFHSDNYIATNGATVFTFNSPDYVFKGNWSDTLAMYDSDKKFLGYQPITSATQTLSNSNTAYIRLSINFVVEGGTLNDLSGWLSNHRYKLEKGSVATDWCPNPTEILTQLDYAKIKAAIVALGGSLS